MAKETNPKYPRPDRSRITPNFAKTADNDALDLGWHEGVLSDGRPFRAEYWCQDQISILTFFLSIVGLETASQADLAELLVREGLVAFKTGKAPHIQAMRWRDAGGNEMWSINVTVGNEDETFLAATLPMTRYSKP